MKKLYLLFITSLLCLTAMAETTIPNNTIYYTTNSGTVCWPSYYYQPSSYTYKYYTDCELFGANIVSNTYENGQGIITFDKDVTSIGDEAFLFCSSLTSVKIPSSVTSIGNHAFDQCTSLICVNIPHRVEEIGYSAFIGCSKLTSIEIPNSVTRIENNAFQLCNYEA